MMTQNQIQALYYNLLELIKDEYCNRPCSGVIVCGLNFKEPYLRCNQCELIVIAVLHLLIKYAYTTVSNYGKFTISYVLYRSDIGETPFTLDKAITFREKGKDLPVISLIENIVKMKGEQYNDAIISKIYIRIYLGEMIESAAPNLLLEDILYKLIEWMKNPGNDVHIDAIKIKHSDSKSRYPTYLTSLKPSSKEPLPFIVADTETVLVNNVHIPYAIGFMEVKLGDVLSSKRVETYYCTDYPDYIYKTFDERVNKMLFDFLERVAVVVRKNPSLVTVYFHNLSRFDGILLLKYFVNNSEKYTVKPLIRNNEIYQIKVYRGNKLLYNLQDSLKILPRKLNDLAMSLCPQLGIKGDINFDEIKLSNLEEKKELILEYMKQDIILLGGVILKAQEIYWMAFKVDIVKKLSISSLALCIFRTHYYDPDNWNIYIPNKNEDTFIRRGYYGGHADAYIPKGENLYHYDVNSLYPFIMKNYPMPAGKPVWNGNLQDQDLNNLFGFIEAHVECPPHITRPFLPYKDKKNGTLLFATGEFDGVYYSEELKYARDLGYRITPLSGYLFENNNSTPFGEFVSDIFERRQKAKSEGNNAMTLIYKLIMNSLYGRFGISPKFTTTEICDKERYNQLLKMHGFQYAHQLNDNIYVIAYKSDNTEAADDWSPTRLSAVQLSSAITAYARIYMYKYISREDCYYTDTDSVILGNPLPEEEISSTELGKFKFEGLVSTGIFLAPKCYTLKIADVNGNVDGYNIIKHKGAARMK